MKAEKFEAEKEMNRFPAHYPLTPQQTTASDYASMHCYFFAHFSLSPFSDAEHFLLRHFFPKAIVLGK